MLAPNTLRHAQARVFVGLNRESENDKINGVHYKFDDVSNDRVGKKLAGAYFKPYRNSALNVSKRMPTVNVFNTLNVQISGRTGLNKAKDILKKFSKAFKRSTTALKFKKQIWSPS